MKNKLSDEELRKIILEEYQKEKGIICGCEEISFEDYFLFRKAELIKKLEK